jgi:hypothetical protein
MPPVLVSPEDAALWLGITNEAERASLGPLVEAVEAHLSDITGVRFGAAGVITDEPHNGTGLPHLWLDQPVATLTAIKIGRDLATPSLTLDVADPDVVLVDARFPRRIVRPLGATFPRGTRNVHVTYTALDHRPADAAMALKEAVAFVWRRRGSEEARTEKIGTYVREISNAFMRLPMWKAYVNAHATKVL